MVENVVEPVEEESVSHQDAFDAMWTDGNKLPNLETVKEEPTAVVEEPVVETGDNVPAEGEGEPAQLEAEPEPTPTEEPHVERPTVASRDPYAWIESLPEEQREMANRLKHEALSDRGRVSALTRKNQEITTELAQAHSKPVTAASEDAGVTTAPQLSESLKQLQEDYPELGKQLTEIYAAQEASLEQKFSDQLKPIQEARTADALASEQERLEAAASDIFNTKETGTHWQDVVKSEDFTAWLTLQPQFIQTTARESNNAQDGIDVLRLYETNYQAVIAEQDAAEASDATHDATQRGDQLQAQRQQRKATTASPESRPAGTDTEAISGDYDSDFNAMWGGKKK